MKFSQKNNKTSAKLGTNKNKKIRVFATASLALLIGLGGVLGFTTATSSYQASSLIGNSSTTTAQSQLLNSTLNLDPENDPVVYTTKSGLEIKYANSFTNSYLAGYTYFTMGEYNSTPLNWVIIGYDPSMSGFVGNFTGETALSKYSYKTEENKSFVSTLDETPAGIAIATEYFAISSNAVDNDEIGKGCVLCFAEKSITTSIFHSSGNNYETSTLKTTITNLFNNLNLTDEQKSLIIPQTLISYYGKSSSPVTTENAYLFPFAHSQRSTAQNFCIDTYLTPETWPDAVFDNDYWLRSGDNTSSSNYNGVYHIQGNGVGSGNGPDHSHYVRPAFVLKII